MDYAIVSFKETEKGIDFNNSIVDTPDGNFTLRHLTEKGYYSNKSLYLDIDFLKGYEDGQPILYVTKEIVNFLEKKYTTKGKVWTNQPNNGISRALAIANHCTKNGGDIYDRG